MNISNKTHAPKKRDKEASKQKLLQAAIEVFSHRGYDATTTKEIAWRAGISEALIQRYFGSKAGLLFEIVKTYENKCEIDEIACTSLPIVNNLADDFTAYLNLYFNSCETQENILRVMLSRAILDKTIAEQFHKNVFEQRKPSLLKRLHHLQSQGHLPQHADLEMIALSLIAMGFQLGFISHKVMGVRLETLRQIAAEFAKTFAAGLTSQ